MLNFTSLLISITFTLASADANHIADQKEDSINAEWVASVLKGEKLTQLLKEDFDTNYLSGLIFKPDAALTETIPVFSPPPVDEGIFIPGIKKEIYSVPHSFKID